MALERSVSQINLIKVQVQTPTSIKSPGLIFNALYIIELVCHIKSFNLIVHVMIHYNNHDIVTVSGIKLKPRENSGEKSVWEKIPSLDFLLDNFPFSIGHMCYNLPLVWMWFIEQDNWRYSGWYPIHPYSKRMGICWRWWPICPLPWH